MNAPESVEQKKGQIAIRVSSAIRDHLALVISSVFFILVVLRLLIVSHGSGTSATALLKSAGSIEVALAAVITVVRPSLAVAFALGITVLLILPKRNSAWMLHYTLVLLVLVLAGAILLPNEFFVLLGVTAFYLGSAFHYRRRAPTDSAESPYRRNVDRAFLTMLVAGLLFLPLLSDEVWLPPERIEVGGGVEIGYIVESDGEWSTLLVERDRKVIRLRTGDIKSRTVCRVGGEKEDIPFLLRLQGERKPRYDKC